jgi:penicillin-binding protein 2
MAKFNFSKKEDSDLFSIREGEIGKLKDFSYRFGWTEDSFVSGKEMNQTISKSFKPSKVKVIIFAFLFLLFFLLGRVAWLQTAKNGYYLFLAEGNRIRNQRIEPKRGIIYDSERHPLCRNVANFMLYFIPADLPSSEKELGEIIKNISVVLGDKSEEELKQILAKVEKKSLEAYQPLFIEDNITYEKAMLLYLKTAQWPGVILSNKSRREYDLASQSLSHILGYTGKISEKELAKVGNEYFLIDYLGKTGIEYFWEPDLKGKNGQKQIEVDALGKEKKIISQTEAEDGHNLVLSINTGLQKKIEETMVKKMSEAKLTKGVGIALNPQNGEILALVNIPSFNSNDFARGIKVDEYNNLANNPDKPLFNRAISGEYPSGSTIKPIMAAAALEEGIIDERTSFLSVGGIRVGQWFFPDWKAGGHGVTNVRKALAESVNTFFYYIGGGNDNFNGLGVEKIVEYEKLFGLGAQTGVDLSGEASGFLPTKEWKEKTKGERWYIGDTYHLAIGQGDITVTPLQVALYTSVFANGGKLYRPHIVKEILSSDDKLIQSVESVPVRSDFISANNIKIVREGMRQTVTAGSARSLGDLPVPVAGKTGTAQWSSEKNPHAWFTGFAPYDNPEIVITILVEEGKEGSTIAVPIAKEVLNWYFSKKN